MGVTKTEDYTLAQVQMADVLKALGHPARLAIVEYLARAKDCISGDIVDELPLAQPTVSRHLKELKEVGLIKGTIDGRSVCYCLDKEKVAEVVQYFGLLLETVNNQDTNCC